MIAQAATKHGLDPRSISFKGAIQTLEAFQPMIAILGQHDSDFCLYVCQQLLDAVAIHPSVRHALEHVPRHLISNSNEVCSSMSMQPQTLFAAPFVLVVFILGGCGSDVLEETGNDGETFQVPPPAGVEPSPGSDLPGEVKQSAGLEAPSAAGTGGGIVHADQPSAGPKFESPEDCMNAHYAALRAGDFKTYLACKTPAAQEAEIGLRVLQLASQIALPTPTRARAIELLDKHGINDVDAGELLQLQERPEESDYKVRLAGSCVDDKAGFLAAFVEALGLMEALASTPAEMRLTNLAVDGDVATGTVGAAGGGSRPTVFRKIGGAWLIAETEDEPVVPQPYTAQQRDAIAKLEQKGLLFHYMRRDGWPLKRFRVLDRETFGDSDLEPLRHLTTLLMVAVDNTQVTDKSLGYLKPLTMLQMLDLSGTKITDAGLPLLYGHAQLKTLDLRNTSVSEAAVEKLRKNLPGCQVTAGPVEP